MNPNSAPSSSPSQNAEFAAEESLRAASADLKLTAEAEEKRLATLAKKVDEIHDLVISNREKSAENKRKNSRLAITVAFMALGAKIGGMFAVDSIRELLSGNKVGKEFEKIATDDSLSNRQVMVGGIQKLIDMQENSVFNKMVKESLVYGTIGVVVGGAIGWWRGDAIDDVHDLLKHPWESFKKIIGIKSNEKQPQEPIPSPKETGEKTAAKEASPPVATAAETLPENSKWRNHVSPAEKEAVDRDAAASVFSL
jgi:hypothetical protein